MIPAVPAERILVVKLADFGDALLATPAIGALRRHYPGARIDALAAPAGAAALSLSPDLDQVLPFDKAAFDDLGRSLSPKGLPSLGGLALRLRGGRYDLVVLLHHLTTRFGAVKFRGLCLASGAPVRAGLDNGRGAFLTHRAPDYGYGGLTELEYGIEVVRALGVPAEPGAPRITLQPTAVEEAETLLRAAGVTGRYVVIHPSVGGYAPVRGWGGERFAALAHLLAEDAERQLVVVGSDDAALAARAIGARASIVDLVGRTSVAHLAAVLQGADLAIGCDSGIVHLASAVATPLIAIFGPSNSDAWRPYGANEWRPQDPLPTTRAVVARAGLPCSPCFYVGYGLGRRGGCGLPTCLDLVLPEQIAHLARHILSLG